MSASTNGLRSKTSTTSSPADAPEPRVEPIPKPGFPHDLYPRWIGHKFDPDGTLLPFPGSTVICHLNPKSQLYTALQAFHNELKRQPFASLFVLLPPTSWHMTVWEGVSDQIRKRASWPGELELDCPLETCTSLVSKKLKAFDLDFEPPFKMLIQGWEPIEDGIGLRFTTPGPEEERELRQLRNRISEHLQMRHPGHESYTFHMGLAYTLRYLDEHESQMISSFLESYRSKLPTSFELGQPEFCTFNDMFAFEPHFNLRSKA